MPLKDWYRKHQPIQLYIILSLTTIFFIAELIYSHITHALTLLIDSYHTLCNILALTGCIIAIKYGENTEEPAKTVCPAEAETLNTRSKKERTLKNTFGWARIDVVSMLVCCIFIASLSFSVVVEALQTLVHIDHLDEMHHPLSVVCIGVVGVLLNVICYLLIGGYTFHQGSFMYITESGDVVLSRVVVPDMVRQDGRRLSRTRTEPSSPHRQRQGFWEMCRDALGSIFIIVCALLVHITDKNIAKYIDPIMSLISATILIILSYPYMKESCLILLQTIPGSMDIESLKKDLLHHFPDIVNVHDFHVWQLTADKVISTVHIIFENKMGYEMMMKQLTDYFNENSITHVTIQPEFLDNSDNGNCIDDGNILEKSTIECLMQCEGDGCKQNHCCPNYTPKIQQT